MKKWNIVVIDLVPSVSQDLVFGVGMTSLHESSKWLKNKKIGIGPTRTAPLRADGGKAPRKTPPAPPPGRRV